MTYKLITFDLDGTLLKLPAISVVLSFVDASKLIDFNKLEELLAKGVISYEEALEKELKLLSGIKIDDIKRALDNAPFIEGISEVILELKLMGLKVMIISDNPDIICEHVAKKFGFEDFLCSKLIVKNNIIIGIKKIITNKDIELEKYISRFNIKLSECIHVGDWLNDIPLFEKVGLGIGLNPKNNDVRKKAKIVIETNDLRDILRVITPHLT